MCSDVRWCQDRSQSSLRNLLGQQLYLKYKGCDPEREKPNFPLNLAGHFILLYSLTIYRHCRIFQSIIFIMVCSIKKCILLCSIMRYAFYNYQLITVG